jgi:hypothetical protein
VVGCFHKRQSRAGLAAGALACGLLAASATAALSDNCKPLRPRPIVVLKDMGACAFDPQNLSFSGDPVQQARCLMRGMDATRNLKPMLESLPPALASRIGKDSGLPARETLSAYLSKHDLEWDFAAYLWQPLARARDNDPTAPMVRYIVFHDTSGPNFGRRVFPADINDNPKINNLASFKCLDGWGRAHVVINRSGGILLNHELSVPWRETKFERALNFSGALKGLFIHVEMIQPRRSAGGHGWSGNDAQTPDPSFTTAEYDRLALVYTIASVRAGHWLIPAFHAAIDAHIPNGHDDPLNFDIAIFAASLQGLMEELQSPDATHPARAPNTSEAAVASAPGPSAATSPQAAPPPAPEVAVAPSPAAAIATAPVEKTEVKPSPADAAASPPPEAAPAAPEAIAKADEAAPQAAKPQLAEVTPQSAAEPGEHKPVVHPVAGSNEHCQTIVVRGHSRRVCAAAPSVAENHWRPRHARLVRPATDYGFPNEGRDTWRDRRDARSRDSWDSPRHDGGRSNWQ